jgi:hypothetical protein
MWHSGTLAAAKQVALWDYVALSAAVIRDERAGRRAVGTQTFLVHCGSH